MEGPDERDYIELMRCTLRRLLEDMTTRVLKEVWTGLDLRRSSLMVEESSRYCNPLPTLRPTWGSSL